LITFPFAVIFSHSDYSTYYTLHQHRRMLCEILQCIFMIQPVVQPLLEPVVETGKRLFGVQVNIYRNILSLVVTLCNAVNHCGAIYISLNFHLTFGGGVDCGACCISSNTRFTYLFTYLLIFKTGSGYPGNCIRVLGC